MSTALRILGGAAILAMGPSIFAQPPLIYSRSIYNAASYMPPGIVAGAIARGSIFSIFGARIGPAQAVTANTYPLGTTLGTVSITLKQGSTSVNVLPIYVSASQINAIMPSNAPLGAASLQVTVNGSRSNMAPVQVASSAFGIFTALGTGAGPGILQNFVTATNQPINSPTITAQSGQAITLWGTGLGAVPSDTVAPTAGNLAVQTEVFVGGVSATVLYNGRAPCCAGTDQIVFQVPNNAPTGCWVPVYVRTGGSAVSNVVSMAIQPNGGVCATDVFPQVTGPLVSGGRAAAAGVIRATTRQDVGLTTPQDVTADYFAYFAAGNVNSYFAPGTALAAFPYHPLLSFIPSGTCTVYTLQGDLLGGDPLPGLFPAVTPLDLGPSLSLSAPGGSPTLSPQFAGSIGSGFLGGSISNNILRSSLVLDPGSYTLKGSGGTNVGAFSNSFTVPQPLVWTGRNQLSLIDRKQPLTISWTGGDNGQAVAVVGFGEDLPNNSSVAFACIAKPGASSFTVPQDILSNLPQSHANPLRSKDVIYLINIPGASVQSITASGLDQGLSGYVFIQGKTVIFQ
jgi:uncharacterized protein (TIGR03437 family)